MENYKRRLVSCVDDDDRMSNLPEHLIDAILERLPFEDVVRTSIISKKWRYTWTSMKVLVFDEQFTRKFAKNGAFVYNGFMRIINKVLILHKGSILKFHLHIPNMFLDSFQEVDLFILLLSKNGVRELILTNVNRRYKLSCHVFSCLRLTRMKLSNCFFKPPLEFEGFPNLEELLLYYIDFGATTMINLPQLKKLGIHTCTNVYNFNIKATKLQTLTVYACPDAKILRLLDSPCLFAAMIVFQKPIKDFVRVEKMNLAMMLSNLPRVKDFYIDNHFLKFLVAENIPKWLPHPVNSLKHLHLRNSQLCDSNQLYGALCLLRNSPNLETFYMSIAMEPQGDVGPASNHLESSNCLECTLNLLQTVEITSIEGSRPELLFIKLLLAHSPSLEKFTIRPSKACNVQKRLDIAKDVMQFTRASTKAKIFYLDL